MMSRRDTSTTSAATLVFGLKGTVDSRAPLKRVTPQAMLYQLSVVEFNVTNPFQQGKLAQLFSAYYCSLRR